MGSHNRLFSPRGRFPRSSVIAQSLQRYTKGFTLFELLIVMGIVGILSAIAIPSYRYVTNTNRIANEVNGLLGDLQFARSEAIKNGQPVSVCAFVTVPMAAVCSNTTAWNIGWIIFSDVNGNGAFDSSTDTILRVQRPFSGTDTFSASGGIAYVSFNREGFASGASGFVTSGTVITLHATPSSTSSTRCLSISLIGLMQVLPYTGGTCT